MEMQLDDKVVLITGASGGIGRAMAEAFAAEGARVVLHGHSRSAELEAWLQSKSWKERALLISCDVSSADQVQLAFDQVRDAWGRIDVAIANAGVWPAANERLWELPEERLRQTLDTNLFGVIWTARSFMRQLKEYGPRSDGHGASLLFTGSTAAQFGERGHSDYATSKAALYGLMRSLKNEITELDPYARVNIIEPGWTVTEMARKNLDEPGTAEQIVRTMALRQIARACEIARSAVFLASPYAARHISGQVLTVAGGMEGRVLWESEGIDREALMNRLEPLD
ncbi:MAG: 3-oxoacyl-[acyl-carrier protein] reductase [Planctomycetota bacterium]|jgi:3-oxoacyl-[acyl-carrier protein] reductase